METDLEHVQGLADEYWERNRRMSVQEGENRLSPSSDDVTDQDIIADRVDNVSTLKRKRG
jgi:hypothetical protein